MLIFIILYLIVFKAYSWAWLMSCAVLCRCQVSFFCSLPSVNTDSPSCFLSCLCFGLLDFQVGIMHVRRRLTCSCGRSCQCVWLTLWERSICCPTGSSANLQSNWCRNGNKNEFEMEDVRCQIHMLHEAWALPNLFPGTCKVFSNF